MDFNVVCRFCMAKDGPMFNIFDDLTLKAKANALLPNLKIISTDLLPRLCCKHCIYQLNAAYKFKRKCEESDVIFKHHIKTQQAILVRKPKPPTVTSAPIPVTPPIAAAPVSVKKPIQVRAPVRAPFSAPHRASPEEIQIDSDDGDDADVGNVTEPLVVLSSCANLDDQDPLDLGHENRNVYPEKKPEQNQPHYNKNTNEKNDSNEEEEEEEEEEEAEEETKNFTSAEIFPKLEVNSFRNTAVEQQERKGRLHVKAENSSDGFGSEDNEETQSKCSDMGQTNFDDMKMDHSSISMDQSDHISIPEHFLNETIDTTQVNQNGDRFKCPVCYLPFVSRYRLEMHLCEHDGETPYVCPICKKGFAREGGLKAHLKLHTGQRPHVCTVCKKAFSLKGNLKVHLRLHTGEKPFQCTTCMKAFTQKISLTKHLSVHKAIL